MLTDIKQLLPQNVYDGLVAASPAASTINPYITLSTLTTGYVPYVGATANVNLGIRTLACGDVAITGDALATALFITADPTGNQLAMVIEGTAGNNAFVGLQGINNSMVQFKNSTTAVFWRTGNSTTAGTAGLDAYYIGTSSNPDLAFFSIGTDGYGRFLNRVKIGTLTAPTARLEISAGSSAAGSGPFKMTSTATVLTVAEAGVFEFTTDNLFFTITTGAARKRLLMADAVGGLTSGRVPFATTNGRLLDSANMTYTAAAGIIFTSGAGASTIKINPAIGPGIFFDQAVPSLVNYGISGDAANTYLNAPSGAVQITNGITDVVADFFGTTTRFYTLAAFTNIGAPITPTALADLDISTTAAAQLRFRTGGVAPTVPNDGDIFYIGTTLKMRRGATTYNFAFVPTTLQVYTPTNVTTDRSYNANSTTVDELADVLGTLIADLQTNGQIA